MRRRSFTSVVLSCLIVLGANVGCKKMEATTAAKTSVLPVAVPLAADASEGAIRFLEARVKNDPDDFIAANKLQGYYLLRLRETGNVTWLDLATRTAQASLKAMPAEQNVGGLAGLAQAEFAAHEFAAARDHAKQLIELDGNKGYPYQMLTDALLELGDYEGAEKAWRESQQRDRNSVAALTRQARLADLRGQTELAARYYTAAVAGATKQVPASRETLAWCRWQLGEHAFNQGDYTTAEKHYRDALVTYPDYYRALAGLGKTLAARGDLAGAIGQYERVVNILPEPSFVAALGDLYKLNGREKEAQAQYALVEQSGKLSQAKGNLYNRQLALFYADHDLKTTEAFALAKKEYEARRDVFGADALAWTAFKAGHLAEAQTASQEALRLGTKDARMLYHAALIAHAAGDLPTAVKQLKQALQLNPQFDPLQAAIARSALAK